jgi:hypothetical protein
MKTIKFIFLALVAAISMTSCTENYSNGERIGMLTKFSQKGLVWSSWEGTLNTTQTGMNSAAPFDFSVDNDVNDPTVIKTLDSAATFGWKVKIKYHETFGKNWFSNRGETNYFINEVEVLDKNPIGNLFGNDSSQAQSSNSNCNCKIGGKIVDTIYVVIDKTK